MHRGGTGNFRAKPMLGADVGRRFSLLLVLLLIDALICTVKSFQRSHPNTASFLQYSCNHPHHRDQRIILPIRILHKYYNRRSYNDIVEVSTSFIMMMKEDPFRDNNNIRPSLHPITINILVQVLKLRASSSKNTSSSSSSSNITTATTDLNDDDNNNVIWSDQPLDVVMTVSTIASKAIQQRQQSSTTDQMTLTKEEQQTIIGRVIGVMVRLSTLQHLLYTRCMQVPYIQKYNEWYTYGLLEPKRHNENNNNSDQEVLSEIEQHHQQQLTLNNNNDTDDPLFLLNRAECLLALFIHTVEIPELQSKNCTVPDQSKIDFLDIDRQQVLLLQ